MLNNFTCMHQNFPHMRFFSKITDLPPADSRGAATFSGLCDDTCVVGNGIVNEILNENRQAFDEKLNWF